MYSLIIPVFRNEESISPLLTRIAEINAGLGGQLEAVFVIDGSPDRCFEILGSALPNAPFRSQLILLSRNFGSFAAIRAGLAGANGRYFAVMAADLQEPATLILDLFRAVASGEVDVAVGTRSARSDPLMTRLASRLFWGSYRTLVQKDIPSSGVDIFACNASFRNHLLRLAEAHSSLVGLIYWLGFRRREIPYQRLPRAYGRSAWTFRKKLTYLMDSLFSFSDLPVRVLMSVGLLGLAASVTLIAVVVFAKLSGLITVPGYAATAVLITFFAALNILGIGIVGSYTWRAYENTKRRPEAITMMEKEFPGDMAR